MSLFFTSSSVSLLAATAAFSRASDFDALAASSFHPTPLLCLARKRATAGRRAWSQRCTTPMKTMLSPLPPWRPRAANLRPRWRQRHRSRSSHRTRRPEHSVCDARRTAPRVANTLVGNGAAHHPLPRLRNAHARNGTPLQSRILVETGVSQRCWKRGRGAVCPQFRREAGPSKVK